MRTIQGKRALVTGAARGIGRAIAVRLAREGAKLALLDVDESQLRRIDRVVLGTDRDPLHLKCDLCNTGQIRRIVGQLLDIWGGLDILVNNAGVAYYGKTESMPPERWQSVLGVNLLGPVELTRLLLPHLLAQREAHIINVSSMYGYLATNRCSAYHLTKFGLLGFSEALRAEYARSGLGVTALCPGFVQTELFESTGQDGRRSAPPAWICTTLEAVANQAVRAIYRNKRIVMTGWLARLTCLIRRLTPGLFDSLYHVGTPRFIKAFGSRRFGPARERVRIGSPPG